MEKVGAFTERATAEGEWRPGDPATGQKATPMLAGYFNMLQRELLAILTAGGVVPDINTENQVLGAIQRLAGRSVTTVTNADSPKALTVAEAGLVLVDATDGDVTLTLPAAAGNGGLEYTLIRTDDTANTVTITPDGEDTIDGAASTDVAKAQRYQMVCDGSDTWQLPVPFSSEGLAGLIQLANTTDAQGLANLTKALTPGTLDAALKGGNQSLSSSGGYQILPGGLIVQWGFAKDLDSSNAYVAPLPIAFPNAVLSAQASDSTAHNAPTGLELVGVSSDMVIQTTQIRVTKQGSVGALHWLAIGY